MIMPPEAPAPDTIKGAAIHIAITGVKGSAPREVGTGMWVFEDRIDGTIGGGALEWEAMRQARDILSGRAQPGTQTIALGPSLGQCCGGAVTLEFSFDRPKVASTRTPVWIWGAGHVGRALANVLTPIEMFDVTWIDTAAGRFPNAPPDGLNHVIAADPPRLMPHAPHAAHHLIATYSHDIDLALCHAALSHRFASAGVIGSATKWARFRSRLGKLGHGDAEISRIMCPIGDPSLGKHPQAIAIGVAARLLEAHGLQESERATAPVEHGGT